MAVVAQIARVSPSPPRSWCGRGQVGPGLPAGASAPVGGEVMLEGPQAALKEAGTRGTDVTEPVGASAGDEGDGNLAPPRPRSPDASTSSMSDELRSGSDPK